MIEDSGTIYLTSGGDHGCNSIVIWDTSSWAIKAKIKAHSAAVTSIVDMCDGQTLVSGSYDKKINVYNYKKSAVKFSLPNNRSSVTSMLLNSSRNKLISCGFDSMMFVWAITRDQVLHVVISDWGSGKYQHLEGNPEQLYYLLSQWVDAET